MRANDTFNIITGETKPAYPTNSQGRRFASLDVLKSMRQNEAQDARMHFPNINYNKLGTAKDSKLYQYGYGTKNSPLDRQYSFNRTPHPTPDAAEQTYSIAKKRSEPVSLMNATKAQFNIVNHTIDVVGEPNVLMRECSGE